MKCLDKITANGQGLALFWNLENVRPEPMPIKDKKVKVTNQSQIEKRLPEPKPIEKPKPKLPTFRHHIAKPMLNAATLRFISLRIKAEFNYLSDDSEVKLD